MRRDSKIRPFDNYKTAITDPEHFVGRTFLLDAVLARASAVNVLLGGRRIGKTSALRALEWTMLGSRPRAVRRPFPVYISLDVEQPTGLDNFRFILIRRLRDSMERWAKSTGLDWRERYRSFLRQISGAEVAIGSLIKLKLENPEQTRRLVHEDFRHALVNSLSHTRALGFEGVVFILDEAEYIVRKEWANDAWSYIRGLKDTDTALKPLVGLVIAGYRDIAEYTQRVGSPLLNIAEVLWMSTFSKAEHRQLVTLRTNSEGIAIGQEEATAIELLSGGHPFIAQQVVNNVSDGSRIGLAGRRAEAIETLLTQSVLNRTFALWWNLNDKSDGFKEAERQIYIALAARQEAISASIARDTSRSVAEVATALEVLAGTGVINYLGDARYSIGSRLFEEWVRLH
ncbi:hypothetical protein [Variovorax rhizosphaerae]|uniref:ATP-binding protein n=1 Tax=Variovorax rhizosphaerae TaxID=1836200 RepID=A0ABU8WS49_9BURK